MERLKNRIAIITGAGQGISKALALGLAREGAKVSLPTSMKKTLRRLEEKCKPSAKQR